MSWDLLKRFIESDHFNHDPFLSVAYLSRYADHVGIQYVLCSKLRQFSSKEIDFFLPQLCHLLVSVENESMALEEFIIDLCEESVNGALLTFWLFQTYLHDLANNPQSNAFRTCRRVYNKVQHIVFGGTDPPRREKLSENVLPVSLLASFVLAGVAAPFLPKYAGPLAVAQARKPRYASETISDSSQTRQLGRSHTVASSSNRGRRERPSHMDVEQTTPKPPQVSSNKPKAPLELKLHPTKSDHRRTLRESKRPSLPNLQSVDPRLSSSSLPDMRTSRVPSRPPTPALTPQPHRLHHHTVRRHSQNSRPLTPSSLLESQKVRLLRSNYFRSEMQFLTALMDISNRLVLVPKPARLSALRAELALITQDLPAEVDVPVICPATLRDGSPGRTSHHRIVRINPAEATVLNSAERVPYLLMVEVLRDDFNFDPDSKNSEQLLTTLLDKGSNRRRIFDLAETPATPFPERGPEMVADSVFEPTSGDLGSSQLMNELEGDARHPRPDTTSGVPLAAYPPRPSSGANSSLATPRTSDLSSSRTGSPGPLRMMTLPTNNRNQGLDQPDFSALATHMRTAAHMLAQLDSSGSKRPKNEVAAIKAKIIASMQSLEEQSFYFDETNQAPTFDSIMANANKATTNTDPTDIEDDPTLETSLNSGAGAARMENDQKTGGIERRGDRDDPSAATFGEQWTVKKERIKRSSPYGWMKNWDLLSVIVKTGADLRQEAFACQLIQVCGNIWVDADVPVWVKRMRILVTGESSGLIETITNGVSLHSLKRSLTLASAFGEPESENYKAAGDAFMRSLAAYSIISYVIQLKDRHNGNILIDDQGHIIHIDFGFMLSNSPGSVGFEAAPFKLSQDYVDVLGGVGSPRFEEFKKLCKQAFQALRKQADNIITLVEMMGKQSRMPCFSAGVAQVTTSLRQRFQLHLSQDDAEQFVETDLIGKSLGSYYTRL
ncbi:MAG: Phosphatidylinositol 4-kinase pik1alpha (PI4-kinase)(PtdIns-4-kinase) [Trichoglossum hirsutum]|nr:MAG: Phosphatidylinositol 4-kinase pik1alpha (PI4-kinase)(PtdIns-4-kinase) [Trichoglossum hirsutum]